MRYNIKKLKTIARFQTKTAIYQALIEAEKELREMLKDETSPMTTAVEALIKEILGDES